MPVFQPLYEVKLKAFCNSKDIMTKFKWKALHILRIKYCKASGSGNPPPFIPSLWNILPPKQTTRAKQFGLECI